MQCRSTKAPTAALSSITSDKVAVSADSTFWRVLTSLDELLPKGIDDQKQVAGLLENKDNLIRESQQTREMTEQQGLFS